MFFVIWVICAIMVIGLVEQFWSQSVQQQGGSSRAAIFSRFSYQPDFPMISPLTTVDLDRFSKIYNREGPLKLISGRPYRFDTSMTVMGPYQTPVSTWLYPWHFPQELRAGCLHKASVHCQEPVVSIKSEADKLGGLSIDTPKEIVQVSPCFDRTYSQCLGEK